MKVIQMGVGGMGDRWVRAVLDSNEVDYAAIVDIDAAILAEQVEAYPALADVPAFSTLAEALEAVEADGVIDVTPPQFHRPIAEYAMDRGIPVLTEKPLADTLDDAEAIVRKSNETGVLHMVAQNYRYKPEIQALKAAIDGSELGKVGYVTITYHKALHFTGFRKTLRYPLTIDMSIHHFDMMRFLLGSDPTTITGRSWNVPWSAFDNDSTTQLYLEFGDDIKLSYTGSWSGYGHESDWSADWRIDCEQGSIRMVDKVITTQKVDGEDNHMYTYEDKVTVPIPEMERDQQDYLLYEFYEAVTKGKTPGTTCQDNIHSLRMVFAAAAAFDMGQTVKLEEIK